MQWTALIIYRTVLRWHVQLCGTRVPTNPWTTIESKLVHLLNRHHFHHYKQSIEIDADECVETYIRLRVNQEVPEASSHDQGTPSLRYLYCNGVLEARFTKSE